MRKFNRNTFYQTARIKGRPWFDAQGSAHPRKDGCDYLLDRFEATDWSIEWIAYALATVAHETGYTFEPIREKRARVNSAGRANQDRYWLTGFYGRGYVQITWKRNYKAFGIAETPDKALERETAFRILRLGMTDGVFTGKRLDDYLNKRKKDYLNARRIINGLDKAEEIAALAVLFEKALRESLREGEQTEQTSAPVTSAGAVEEGEAGTVAVATDAPTDAASPSPSLTDKLNTAETVATKADTISRSSLWVTLSTKLGGWALLIVGFLQQNWVELLIAVILIAVAVWYFSRSKDRLQERRLNPW